MKAANADTIVQLAAFRVGTEEYVVDIMRVREIIRPVPVTAIRRGPKYVEGVLNLRGAVIPVVDMRRRFELEPHVAPTRKIMIIAIEGRPVGLMVDQVTDVVRVPKRSIQAAPELLDKRSAPYFLGVVHYKGRTLILLNVNSVVATDDPIVMPHDHPTEPAA
jgi:purine-binding chemotaxis protein CheW